MHHARRAALILFLVLMAAAGSLNAGNPGVLFQYSTIQALMAGVYDGDLTFGELQQYGDFGLGTFNALDGEMVALDGQFYQIKADGKVYPVAAAMQTPFADVTFFKTQKTLTMEGPLDWRQLEKRLEKLLPSPNFPYALRITGVFPYIKARSVPRQQPPYPPLLAAARQQAVFEFHDARGDLVGFWTPKYLAGVNVSGYHLHFLRADRKAGGHLLDCRVQQATVQIGALEGFSLRLPRTTEFSQQDLTGDRQTEIRQVEK